MKNKPQNQNDIKENINEINSKETETNNPKRGFFKTIWYSISKIEKYPELSAEGFQKTIKYLMKLILILAIVISAVSVYKTSQEFKQIAQYIEEKVPNFTYKDNKLTSPEITEVIRNESETFGKVIIDLNATEEEQINSYINEIGNEENGIIILNNQMIMKEQSMQGNMLYSYEDLSKQMGVKEFNKENLVNYLTSTQMTNLYLGLFVSLLIYSFAIYIINTLINVFAISLFGYLATFIIRMKIKFVAVFNMGIYAITLATLLNAVYAVIIGVFGYQIKYFDIMYMVVSTIYMIAAIFMLKADFNKKQKEVQKIVEVEKSLDKEEQEKSTKQEDKNENKDTGKNNTNEDKQKENEKKENLDGEDPEGSKA